jgi:rare lipoprotein A
MKNKPLWLISAFAVVLTACGGKSTIRSDVDYDNYVGPTCTDGPKSRYGNPKAPYEVFGIKYRVLPTACGYEETGIASWYGPNFHGKRTSSGETYDMHGMTAAHKTLPIPALVKVTNLENGKTLVLRVNDRGPFHEGRIIDLSKAAAQKLDVLKHGTAKVKVEAIGKPQQVTNPQYAPATKDYRNRLFVQVGSFSSRDSALNVLRSLGDKGYQDGRIQTADIGGKRLYRVQIGPYATPSAAEKVHNHLNKLGYQGHRVITE